MDIFLNKINDFFPTVVNSGEKTSDASIAEDPTNPKEKNRILFTTQKLANIVIKNR